MKVTQRTISILTVAISITAWFVISNHCAIGMATTEVGPAKDECPFHTKSSPAPEKPLPSSELPCCKILRAVTTAKIFVPKTFIVGAVDFGPIIIPVCPRITVPVLELDIGPPGKTSFVELIGSVRAHAPPVFVA